MADKYLIAEWRKECNEGNFIDYDGFGYLGTETKESDVRIYPSEKAMISLYPQYTHVWWYNN